MGGQPSIQLLEEVSARGGYDRRGTKKTHRNGQCELMKHLLPQRWGLKAVKSLVFRGGGRDAGVGVSGDGGETVREDGGEDGAGGRLLERRRVEAQCKEKRVSSQVTEESMISRSRAKERRNVRSP